jgi:hypothetical protein
VADVGASVLAVVHEFLIITSKVVVTDLESGKVPVIVTVYLPTSVATAFVQSTSLLVVVGVAYTIGAGVVGLKAAV